MPLPKMVVAGMRWLAARAQLLQNVRHCFALNGALCAWLPGGDRLDVIIGPLDVNRFAVKTMAEPGQGKLVLALSH